MGLIKYDILKDEIRILIENALMDLGYVKFSIDMYALKADISAKQDWWAKRLCRSKHYL